MERIATGARMRAIDAFTIENGIVPGEVLMERAGEGLTRHLLEIIEENSLTRCVIVSGAGNNGGDGYVAARLLKQQGIPVDNPAYTRELLLEAICRAAGLQA